MSAERCLPISFVDQLVPRILDESKTKTRRLITHPDARAGYDVIETTDGGWAFLLNGDHGFGETVRAPYRVGDRLWVRESHEFLQRTVREALDHRRVRIRYRADGAEQDVLLTEGELGKLRARKTPFTQARPGRFLYKSCARIFLRVTSLRAERLQDITEEDARAEGMEAAGVFWLGAPTREGGRVLCETARGAFLSLWDWLNGKRDGAGVKANPWVWVPGFTLDQVLVRGEGRAA